MTPTPPQFDIQPGARPEIQALHALLTSAAFAPLPNLGWIRVTGSDRVRWLNGMVTNSIAALKPGEGNYCFVLNAQGRIQADLTAFALPDELLIQTGKDQIEPLLAYLDRFIIMDDVELLNATPLCAGLLVAGSRALAIVMALGASNSQAAPCSTAVQAPTAAIPNLKQSTYAGAPVTLIQAHSPLVPRFEIWSDPATIASIRAELQTTQAIPASASDLEHLRLLEGTPLYGTDIRDKDLPQETAQSRALHFAKGCYLGQEIVERIRSRGNVHRTFAGFLLTGSLPPIGTPLTAAEAPGKPLGELTSVASIPLPTGPIRLALGYIRREVLERAVPIHYPGGQATPITLPFAAAVESQTLPCASDSQNPQE